MTFLITFLEGLISFISPCMLPMLPAYVSYFSGNDVETKKSKVLLRSVLFVAGFTFVFVLLGIFAGTAGVFLNKYKLVLNIVCGVIVVAFGLSYVGLFELPFFKGINKEVKADSLVGALVFGLIYSFGLTPCVGAFLGSALAMAAGVGGVVRGGALLLTYSLGLGVPFVLSAVLLDKMKSVFKFIKRHYKIINTISGIFLILIGILIATGLMDKLVSVLA